VEAGCTLTPPSTGTPMVSSSTQCYQIEFDAERLDSRFPIDNSAGQRYVAIFAQHVPLEFERDTHYLYDNSFGPIEAGYIEPIFEKGGGRKAKPWGEAVGASIIVNLVTLIGVFLLIPVLKKAARKYEVVWSILCNSFACGALLAAAFYLILMESTHLVSGNGEAGQAAVWGSWVLAGYLVSPFADMLASLLGLANYMDKIPMHHTASKYSCPSTPSTTSTTSDPEKGSAQVQVVGETASPAVRMRVLTSVLIGDFLHNYCDGIFIGVAFAGCGSSLGWSVTASTIYHEFAQEVADYMVLTDPLQGNLKPALALALNFISGTSVFLGVVTIFGLDEISSQTTGSLLAFSGGVYLQIGASECLPKALRLATTSMGKLVMMLSFFVGGLTIGLVLLDHKHCEVGGHAHAH
jgi:zinc transporter ZupT